MEGIGLDVVSKLCQCFFRYQFVKGPEVSKLAELLKISCILMHRNFDDSIQDSKDLVLRLQAIFELKVLIPKRVSKEVQTDGRSTTFEKPGSEC